MVLIASKANQRPIICRGNYFNLMFALSNSECAADNGAVGYHPRGLARHTSNEQCHFAPLSFSRHALAL